MKRILIFLVVCSYFLNSFGQTNLYVNPAFDSIAINHEIIAIVPFKAQVKLRPKQMKDVSAEQLHNISPASDHQPSLNGPASDYQSPLSAIK